MESKEFLENLDFEYIETYSLLRGDKFQKKYNTLRNEFNTLSAKRKRKALDLNDENKYNEIDKQINYTQYLINLDGIFHFSSEKISTIKKTDIRFKELQLIFDTEVTNKNDWMCAPIYRDALIFYNLKNEIVKILNICLSCEYMETENKLNLKADTKTYDELKAFFIRIGHQIEN